MDDAHLLRIRTRQLEWAGDAWAKAARKALSDVPGASNSSHPAHSLWLRLQAHDDPDQPAVVQSQGDTHG